MTNLAAASTDRYASADFVARFLHAEWADLLLADTPGQAGIDASFGPGQFYVKTAALAAGWAKGTGQAVSAACDVGGATGRMSLELAARFPGLADQVMVEPSAQLCLWARRLLCGAEFEGWMPVPGQAGRPVYVPVSWSPRPATARVAIHQATAAEIPRPEAHFDMVTCLNVADRVPDPGALVQTLGRLLRRGGMLVLACPHHYEEAFTPREKWVSDLRELLNPVEWDVADRVCDVNYGFTRHSRGGTWYSSQVVGAVRRCG